MSHFFQYDPANQCRSNLREIPDHQELFLSPDTLSSLIIEINQGVSDADALSTFTTLSQQTPTLAAGSGSAASATSETIGQAAALYHLHDLCEEGDGFEIISLPQRISTTQLASTAPSGSPVSVYTGIAQFKSVSRQRGGQIQPGAAVAGAAANGDSAAAQATTMLTCHYLLARLPTQETDLLVFFNVPHEEFDKNGDPQGLSKEECLAEDTIGALKEKLEIKDWSLFV